MELCSMRPCCFLCGLQIASIHCIWNRVRTGHQGGHHSVWSRTSWIERPPLTEADSWDGGAHIPLPYTYPSLGNHGRTSAASMLCFSGMHAQRGSVLLDSDPPLRLLFHLSSGLSSLSPNSGSLIYEAQVLSWPRVAQLATAQEGGSDGGLLLRGCSGSVAMCKKLNCSSCP